MRSRIIAIITAYLPKVTIVTAESSIYPKHDTFDTFEPESMFETATGPFLLNPKYHKVSNTTPKVSFIKVKVSPKTVYLTKHFITGHGKVRRV